MNSTETAISTIVKWKGQSSEIALHSKDKLVRVIDKGFNAMSLILSKESDYEDIYRALDLLDRERSISLKFETVKNDAVRDLVYGLLESVYLTMSELTEELNQMKERERVQVKETRDFDTQTDEEREQSGELSITPVQVHLDLHPTFQNPLFDDAMNAKIEPFEDEVINAIEMNPSSFEANYSAADSIELVAAKEESITPPILFPENQDIAEAPSAMLNDDNVNGETNNENVLEKLKNNNEENSEKTSVPCGKGTAKRKRGRPARAVAPLNYAHFGTECDSPAKSAKKTRKSAPSKVNTYFGGDNETTKKGVSKGSATKRISEVSRPWHRNSPNTTLTTKRSGTDMECVECPLKTKSIKHFVGHLRRNHQTTMNLANLVFLCECGNQSRTDWHNSQCDKANFTIMKVNDDPIRRIGSAGVSEQLKTIQYC
ncbi:hypothetical protein PRIPAC_89381 [Pristionchus pacificus]|uniref:Uncharacterized protein n=1 Tax=Pristionchus pacificus TaxID=54126 RepID=A0A2A6CWS9_PRIPA|nr:hypothetical protein PRIPAC_89381 [Pristionchus pacificus]|eukprot:PDM82481.1 hypothetical protein PRIPAC_36874 [Pristionchus pacificus]